MSNRGRHRKNKSLIYKLAKKYGAKNPEKWHKAIKTTKELENLIKTQYHFCKFNNLHVFETENYSTDNSTRGGFVWLITPEGHEYWKNFLTKLHEIVK